MADIPNSRVCQTAKTSQFTYNLNCRIYDCNVYPVLSPQDATIFLCAHEFGIQIIWRGGRRPRSAAPPETKQNGVSSSDDAVMIIDSDDEKPPPSLQPAEPAEFDDILAEDAQGNPEIIQTLDLDVSTACHHLATLPMPLSGAADATWGGAGIVQNRIIFAAACANGDNVLVTLPLTPPSPESKARLMRQKDLHATDAGRGFWHETVTWLVGHSRRSNCLAVTLARPSPSPESPEHPPSTPSSSSSLSSNPATRIIVASHSDEGCGVLRFWEVPMEVSRPADMPRLVSFQSEFLSSPLSGISFNPSRITQLLAIAPPHSVRVYDYARCPVSSQEDSANGSSYPSQGSWLVSLHSPFTSGTLAMSNRKPIIASTWISHGRAILALLADGQWGIWDIDGVSASFQSRKGATSDGLFGKLAVGLRGVTLTPFSASSFLEGSSPLKNPASASQKLAAAPTSARELVPMTPHTRRDAHAASMSVGSSRLALVRGGVEVARIMGAGSSSKALECAILWIGGTDPNVCVIPDLTKFWEAQVRRGGGGGGVGVGGSGIDLFNSPKSTRMIRLANLGVGLSSEACHGVRAASISRQPQQLGGESTVTNAGTPDDQISADGGSAGRLSIEVALYGGSRLTLVRERLDPKSKGLFLPKQSKSLTNGPSPGSVIAYRRPEPIDEMKFDLTVNKASTLRVPRQLPPAKDKLFLSDIFRSATSHATYQDDVHPSVEEGDQQGAGRLEPRTLASGFTFVNNLDLAADSQEEMRDVDDQLIEEELLDVFEIDRELEDMQAAMNGATSNVFFEHT